MVEDTRGPRGPDFLVIGAQRAGTTWLHRVLRGHPELWLPPVKELHYFDQIGKPRSWEGRKKRFRGRLGNSPPIGLWDLRYFFGRRSDEWYAMLFHKAQLKGLIAGEVTPAYAVLDDEVFRRIQRTNPKLKLIFIMRDPIERAWSAVNNALKKGRLDEALTVEAALERARRPHPLARSAYIDTIRRVESIFPPEQLHCCFFDDLAQRPASFVSDILSFLGVTPDDPSALLPANAVNVAARGKTMPVEFKRELARDLLPSVIEMCKRFDGPPHKWRDQYEALLTTNCP